MHERFSSLHLGLIAQPTQFILFASITAPRGASVFIASYLESTVGNEERNHICSLGPLPYFLSSQDKGSFLCIHAAHSSILLQEFRILKSHRLLFTAV